MWISANALFRRYSYLKVLIVMNYLGILFTSVLEDVFRKLIWDNRWGLRINGKRLSNLRFADDIVLVASSARALHQMLLDLKEHWLKII